jgi:predicted metal-dependent hydrolase
MMQLEECPPVEYIKRRNQRNLRIRVKSDAIIVSGPWYSTKSQMASFVSDRQDWIRKTVIKLKKSTAQRNDLQEENEGCILLRGIWTPIVIRKPIPESTKWYLVERGERVDAYPPDTGLIDNMADAVKINDVHSITESTPIKVPKSALETFSKELAKKELPTYFEQKAAQLPFKWQKLYIRSQKTKWGTCSSKGNISLNWRLIKCPKHIWDYLIVHELCHTVHMNHSKSFWELVKKHHSDVDTAHRWLKVDGNLAFL